MLFGYPSKCRHWPSSFSLAAWPFSLAAWPLLAAEGQRNIFSHVHRGTSDSHKQKPPLSG
jgi:hypothetical protein